MNGWQINYWLCITGGRRDNKPDPDRGRPDSRTPRRVPGSGEPPAHSRDYCVAAGRFRRRRTDQRRQPAGPARAGLRAAGVLVGGRHPLRRGPEPRHAEAQGPHPHGGDPPHRARGADHLGDRRLLGRAAPRHVTRRGGDARNHPRRLGADSGGPPAQFRPAGRTAPAGPHLGGVTDRPGWRNPRRAGVPCRYREHPQGTGQPATALKFPELCPISGDSTS